MPQMNLLQPEDDPVGFRLDIIDHTPELLPAWATTIYLRRLDGDWTTFTSHRWTGIEVDYIDTFVREVTHAWMFGDKRDILRTATRVHRAARAHARAHRDE